MPHLDGSTLEGGGQLVRNAISLSALTSQPLHISQIRGNRRGAGGLKASHTAAIEFLLQACGGEADGLHVGSLELKFYPRGRSTDLPDPLTLPSEDAEPSAPRHDLLLHSSHTVLPIKPEYNIKLTTPGSVFLIFQAVYPYILYAGACANGTEPEIDSPMSKVRLNITGGTNVTSSPTYDYFSQVLVPNFAKLGLPPLSARLVDRGWCSGRVQLGMVSFTIEPLKTYGCEMSNSESGEVVTTEATQLSELTGGIVMKSPIFPDIQLDRFQRGDITRIDITVLAPDFPFEQMGSQVKASRTDSTANKRYNRQKSRTHRANETPADNENQDSDDGSNSALEESIRRSSSSSSPSSVRRYLEERTASLLRRALKRDGHLISESKVDSEFDNMSITDKQMSSPSGVSVNLRHSEATSHPQHIYLLLVAHTSNGFRLGRDALYGISDKGEPTKGGSKSQKSKQTKGQKGAKPTKVAYDESEDRVETMIEQCISELMFELNNGDMRCLDTFMRDQVIVFQALGQLSAGCHEEENQSRRDNGENLSLHARTAQWVCKKMLGVNV